MKTSWRNLKLRESILAGVVAMVLLCAAALHYCLRPAYHEWREAAELADMQAMRYARFARNLRIRKSVDEHFERLGLEAPSPESDEIAVSKFLRDLEILARQPSMVLINMKPQPVEMAATHKTYGVRLTVAGKLVEVLKFVSGVVSRPQVTGLKSLSLRGVQGQNMVECSLSVWTVRLLSKGPAGVPKKKPAAGRELGAAVNE